MIVKSVTFYIKPEHHNDFITATLENQRNSRKEPGIIYFEFLKSEEDENKFILFEGYNFTDAVEDHLETEHFKIWIQTVESWFEKPREREILHSLET